MAKREGVGRRNCWKRYDKEEEMAAKKYDTKGGSGKKIDAKGLLKSRKQKKKLLQKQYEKKGRKISARNAIKYC